MKIGTVLKIVKIFPLFALLAAATAAAMSIDEAIARGDLPEV